MVDPALSLTTQRTQRNLGEAYLKFQVGQGVQVGLIMKHVQEVLVLPTQQLTPMPNMPVGILGLMHRRSRVMWVMDLALLLDIGVLDYSPQQYDIVIIRTGGSAVALAVRQVEGISWMQPTQVQPLPSHVTKGLIPYARGCVLQAQEVIFLLDGEAILQAPLLQAQLH